MNINVDKSGNTFTLGYSLPQTCGGSRNITFNKEHSTDTWYTISDDGNGILTVAVDSNSSAGALPREGKVFTNLNGNQCSNNTIYINQAGDLLCNCNDIQIWTFTIPASGMTSGEKIGEYTAENDCFASLELSMSDESGETYGLSVGGNDIYLDDPIPQNLDSELKLFDIQVQVNGTNCNIVHATQEGNEIKCDCNIIQRFIRTEKRTFPRSGGTYIIASGNTYGCSIVKVDVESSSSDTMYNAHNNVKAPWVEYNGLSRSEFIIKANVSSRSTDETSSVNLLMVDNEGTEMKCGYNFEIERTSNFYFSNPEKNGYWGGCGSKLLCEDTSGEAIFNLDSPNTTANTWVEFYSPNEWIHFTGNVRSNTTTQLRQGYTIDQNLTGDYRVGEIKCRILIDRDSSSGHYSEIYSKDYEGSECTFTQAWCDATCCESFDLYNWKYGNNQRGYTGTYYIPSSGSAMTFNFTAVSRFDCDSVTYMRVKDVDYKVTGVSINYSSSYDSASRRLLVNILPATEYVDVEFTLNCEIEFNSGECTSPFAIKCRQSGSPITSTSEALSVICPDLVDSDNELDCFDEECMTHGHRYWETTTPYSLSGVSMSLVTCDSSGNETNYPWLTLDNPFFPSGWLTGKFPIIIGNYTTDLSYACGNDLEAYIKLKITNDNDSTDYIICNTLHKITVDKIVCDCSLLTITPNNLEESAYTKQTGETINVGIMSSQEPYTSSTLFKVSTPTRNGDIKLITGRDSNSRIYIYDINGTLVRTTYVYAINLGISNNRNRTNIYVSTTIPVPNSAGTYTYYAEYGLETYSHLTCTTSGDRAEITITVTDPQDPTPKCTDWSMTYTPLIDEIPSDVVRSGTTGLVIGEINETPPTNFSIRLQIQNYTYLLNPRLVGTNVLVDVNANEIVNNTNITVNIYKVLNGSDCTHQSHTLTLLAPTREGGGE